MCRSSVLTAAGHYHWLLALISSHRCGKPVPDPKNVHGAGAGHGEQHGCDHARLSVDGFVRGKGELAAPPQIQYGRVTGAFVQPVQGARVLDVRFIADLAKLDHGHSELDADLRGARRARGGCGRASGRRDRSGRVVLGRRQLRDALADRRRT